MEKIDAREVEATTHLYAIVGGTVCEKLVPDESGLNEGEMTETGEIYFISNNELYLVD